jgi:hypothetical protein
MSESLSILPADSDPGPVPGEDEQIQQTAEKARQIKIALATDAERILRMVSERTGITIAELRKAIEESPQVAEAARQALKFRYDEWWQEKKGAEDIFGRKEG